MPENCNSVQVHLKKYPAGRHQLLATEAGPFVAVALTEDVTIIATDPAALLTLSADLAYLADQLQSIATEPQEGTLFDDCHD